MRTFARIIGCCAALVFSGAVLAQAWPARAVRIIVPFAAGGPTDVMARILAQKLSENLGQPFVVDNRAGAGGNIGMAIAAKAAADGYTLVLVSSSFVVNPGLYSNVPYDPYKDFAPITLAAASPNLIVVHPSIPAKTLAELVSLVKANPGKYSYAQPGIGTTPHLSGELFRLSSGLDMVSTPFGGAAPAMTSTLAGHTPIAVTALPPALAHVKGGTVRALAITAGKRSPELPDVPTMAESGFTGQEAETMQGLLAPAGTPREIVLQLQREVAKIVALPEVRDKLAGMGFDPIANTPEQFGAYIHTEITRWTRVVREANLKVE